MIRIELMNLILTKDALYRLSYMGTYCFFFVASGAGDEVRTRDFQLGRLKLYQLSYSRPVPHRNPPSRVANVWQGGF